MKAECYSTFRLQRISPFGMTLAARNPSAFTENKNGLVFHEAIIAWKTGAFNSFAEVGSSRCDDQPAFSGLFQSGDTKGVEAFSYTGLPDSERATPGPRPFNPSLSREARRAKRVSLPRICVGC